MKRKFLIRFVVSLSLVSAWVLGFFYFTPFVSAVGIGLSPSSITAEVRVDRTHEQTIIVQNISGKPAVFELFSDDFETWFSFSESNFALDVNGIKEVLVKIDPDLAGEYETNISVVSFLSETKTVNTGSGIKIPVKLSVRPRPKILGIDYVVFYTLLAGFFLMGMVATFAVFRAGTMYHTHVKKLEKK